MKIIQLEKDANTVLAAAMEDSVLFVEYVERPMRTGDLLPGLHCKNVSKMTINEIKKYVENPNVVIVRIEP